MKIKTFIRLAIYIGATSLLLSCRSTKEFTYFQNISKDEFYPGLISKISEYKVKTFDNLYINIKTLNPEVNALFDAGGTASGGYNGGTSSNYGDSTSKYINGYQVDSNGMVSLPIIGQIEVLGLSLIQIQEKIHTKSLYFLKDPTVTVKLLSFKVNVTGEVKSSGIYYSYSNKISIFEAISLAGGVTDNAKIKNVLVIRQVESGTRTYNLDLTKKDILTSEAYYLQPDDLIYVKPSRNKKTELNATSYSLFLSTITTLLLIYNIIK